MQVKLRLLKDYTVEIDGEEKSFKKDTNIKADEDSAEKLIADGMAMLLSEWKEKQEAEAAEKEEQKVDIKEIAKQVVQALKDEKDDDEEGVEAKSVVLGESREYVDPTMGYSCFAEFAKDVAYAGEMTTKGLKIPDVVSKRLDRIMAKDMHDRKTAISTPYMQTPDDDQGGYLVPQQWLADLWKRTYDEGQVLSRVRDIPMQSTSLAFPVINETSRVDGSRMGGVRVYRVAEGEQKTASKPNFGEVELTLRTLVGMVRVTNKLLRHSAISIEPLLTDIFTTELRQVMEYEFIWGTGANQPLGITVAGSFVSQAKQAGQAATTIVAENIINMYSRLWAPSRANAVWHINQDCLPQLHTMSIAVGVGGVPVYIPGNQIAGAPYGTLYGLPVIPLEQCETLGTVGDILLCDWSQYLHGRERRGIDVASSIHLLFDYNATVFRFELENDGQPLWRTALTPWQSTTTQGPFIGLATRA
jgi:HK97 family phage major capsid protein